MKPATSWTKQEAARQKCAKRFFLTYLDTTGVGAAYKSLKSTRELGGYAIHGVLADIIRAVAEGGRISDHPKAGAIALSRFEQVVQISLGVTPWERIYGLQVAEIHNGIDAREEIDHWREIIPRCIENGLRVMSSLGLRSNSSDYRLLAETEVRFEKTGRERRCVIDLLIEDGKNRMVVDWKCHGITNSDLSQVRLYQEYIAKSQAVPFSRLHGLAVDLIREETIEAHYRPLDRLLSHRPSPGKPTASREDARESYPAHPSCENCARCPFAAVCADSVVRPPFPINAFMGGFR
ncbi:MAG: PD-(D/E)XK nuclease family protein [Terrimicrobiaceae bacterium]